MVHWWHGPVSGVELTAALAPMPGGFCDLSDNCLIHVARGKA